MNRFELRSINWDGIIFFAAVLFIWEVSAIFADSYSFPKATDVAVTMWRDSDVLLAESLATLRRTMVGFFIALVVTLPLGILIGRISLLADIIEPLIEFLRPLPPIAMIPISMMVLGIGDAAKLVVVIYGASFPILINTVDAVRVQDPMQSRVARSLRLTTFERMVFVDLPSAMPRIVAGIRLSITVALLLAIVSEMILSTDGLGDYLSRAHSSFNMTKVVSAILAIAVLSVLVTVTTNRISYWIIAWHHRRVAGAGN